MTLNEIGLLEGTDKSSSFHNYLDTYESLIFTLRDRPIKMVEFGVGEGASIRTWRRYFKNASIWAVDIVASTLRSIPESTHGVCGDVNDPEFWKMFSVSGFDLAIDDGDHHCESQIHTLNRMLTRMNPGGWYIIEDIHFSGKAIRTLVCGILDNMNDYWVGDCGDPEKSKSPIGAVHLHKSLIAIQKRQGSR